ncbi:hypothetical protein SULAZ_0303 [Sulfurihydrogenibium azorense Az-Fu1]|uniref:DUF3782 domain-containing protein n=1 Tax=Sulfurihydrogenibium azorense (strain DSM 15241 / OCM 825 / Az-Fu1) TaxID=204536 RepID=C1DT61_SULAA|nr:hypothetical protein [Sulfurihydrogenibium azorense]ACN99730.1 hypothetical protein SULAZ_0303 [Sulfurihydrogenibium azorense Az-Fu1]
MQLLEDRVSHMEEIIMKILYMQQETQIELKELQLLHKKAEERLDRFEASVEKMIAEIKADTQNLKKEMAEFKTNIEKTITEMKADTERFKTNMEKTVAEMKIDFNKKWGELSNKLGTIVEDIIFPASKPVLEKYFNCEITDIHMNRKRKKDNLKDEFDVIAVSDPCKTVYLIEVKATPKVDYINEFKNEKLERFKALFPEYENYKLVPIFASLRLEDDIVNYLTKNKIYAMAYREWEYMDILNFDKLNQERGE